LNLPFFIARRYLVSKKTYNIINIISGISVTGVLVGTMALIIILSVFNGFEKAVVSMFNVFDPDLEISLKEGKTFRENQLPREQIMKLEGVVKYTRVLQENGLLRYRDKQYLASIKGVDNNYVVNSPLDSLMIEGDLVLEADSFNFAIPGFGIAYYLDIHVDDPEGILTMYVPDREKRLNTLSENTLRAESIRPSGIFSVQQDFDNKYVFVPLRFARQLFNYTDEISSVEILLDKKVRTETIQKEIQKIAGPEFVVKNRLQQQEILYKTMKSEKWAVFMILTFILLIASFNVIGSVTMLIIDKKHDIATLASLGANRAMIRRVFFLEGMLITLTGAIGGMLLGGLVCWLQMHFGLIKLQGSGSFIMSAYPVAMKTTDFLLVFVTVISIGLLASWIPVRRLSRKFKP